MRKRVTRMKRNTVGFTLQGKTGSMGYREREISPEILLIPEDVQEGGVETPTGGGWMHTSYRVTDTSDNPK